MRSFSMVLRSTTALVLVSSAVAQARAQEAAESPIDVDASVSITEEYTDNVFDTENYRVDDLITIIQPSLGLSAKGERVQASVGADLEIGRFAQHQSENYEDFAVRGAGEAILADGIKLFGGADYAWEHEERSSPDDVNGEEPTLYQLGTAYAGVLGEFDKVTLRVGGNVRHFNFDDVQSSTGTPINNDDRDRLESEVGARAGYKLDPATEVFAQGIYDRRVYRAGLDDALYDRDSDGFQAGVGVKGQRGPVSGEIKVGVLHHTFDDPRFDSITTLDLDADLRWVLDPNFILYGTLARSINETTITGASSYTDTTASIAARQRFASDLFGNAYFSIAQNDYNDVDRTDYLAWAGFGLEYFVLPQVFVGAEYAYSQRLSDVPGVQFDSHSAMLRVGAQWDRAYPEGAPTAQLSGRGFYVGGQIADGGLETRVDGPRGGPGGPAGGNLTAAFGEQGLSGGVLAGYRIESGDLVAGLELDLQIADQEWTHSANRTFSVRRKDSAGLSLIAGHKVRGDAIVYARGGVIGTQFENDYQRGGNSVTDDDRQLGLSVGMGTEFPISGGFSARMEYVVTAYEDYFAGATPGTNDDNFANVENQARLGLIYRFGAGEPQEAPPPVDFSGPYVGAQAGHGMLTTENSGPRTDPPTPFVLDVTRAGHGFTGGVFAGYGYQYGSLFAAAEVEAELSNTDWHIDRDPNGRLYSVAKDWTVGVAARGGYVLNDSVLLYGRVGVVGTQFTTDYQEGANSVNQEDVMAGLRFGGGVEVALNESTRVRMDYTRTEYDAYTVDYTSGVDSFDNSENLFRVGISHRF